MKYRTIFLTIVVLLMFALSGMADKRQKLSDDKKTTTTEQTDRRAASNAASVTVTEETVDQAIEPLELSLEETPVQPASTAAADHQVPWKSINGGGGNAETATHKVSVSIGQATIGFATTATHQAGIGYWYGIGGTCDCGFKGDMNCDGNATPLDVIFLINYVYKDQDDLCSAPNCPYEVGDMNCDDNRTPLDVIFHINLVYKDTDDCCDGCIGPT